MEAAPEIEGTMKLSEIYDVTDKKVKDKAPLSCDKQNVLALEQTKPYKARTSSLQKNTELPYDGKNTRTPIWADEESPVIMRMKVFVEFVLNCREDFRAGNLITIPSDKLRFTHVIMKSGLYMRKEYFRMYEVVKSAIKEAKKGQGRNILVVGSPGVGKSVFGIFCLMLLIREGQNFTYTPIHKEKPIYIAFRFGTISISFVDKDEEYIGLYDQQESKLVVGHKPVKILLTSPENENFYRFKKNSCSWCFMAPWSLDECADFAAKGLVPPDTEWYERFKIVGGVARYLFGENSTKSKLKRAVDSVIPSSQQELKSYLDSIVYFNDQSGSRNILFHYHQSIRNNFYVTFASIYILVQVANKTKMRLAELLSTLLCSRNFDLQVVQSKIFEQYFLSEMTMPRNISFRSLEEIKHATEPNNLNEMTWKEVGARIFHSVKDDIKKEMLYVPMIKDFPAIDAILVLSALRLIIYVQCAADRSRAIVYAELEEVYNAICENKDENGVLFRDYSHALVFAVTEDAFSDYEKQRYLNAGKAIRECERDFPIRQFAAKLDK